MEFAIKVVVSGVVIASASWLSGRAPVLAGFFVALPISTAIVLPMSYIEHGSVANTTLLAKSIAVAVPLTLAFFLPFVFGERIGLGFWPSYILAFVCLGGAYVVHRLAVQVLFRAAG